MKLQKIFFALMAALLLVACSPASKGKKVAKNYCKYLTGYEFYNSPDQYQLLKMQAQNMIAPDFNKYMAEYAMNPVKKQEFLNAYNLTVTNEGRDFIFAYESAIRAKLDTVVWFLEKDENKFYLYEYGQDSLHILGCKNGVSYYLNQDTLIFDDGTKAMIAFTGDSTMTLTNANDLDQVAEYKIATSRDMICGFWTWRSTAGGYGTATFSPKGGQYFYNSAKGRGWSNTWRMYTAKDGSYRIGNSASELGGALRQKSKYNMTIASSSTENYTRTKKDIPADMRVIFGVK